MLLSNVLGVIWVGNISLINYVSSLPLMEPFTKLRADTPKQNGVAERKHRHIVKTTRSLLFSISIPSEF
jgi:hypothetical protein